MKKIFYSLFAVASLLLATSSCSSEEELIPSGKNEGVEVSFQLALDDAASSRALTNDLTDDVYGKGKQVNNVIAAVYSNGMEIVSLRKPTNIIKENLTCDVTFRLIEGQTYDFVFWAEKTGTGFYTTTDLKAIKVNYAGDANDEDRDAFTAVRKGLTIKNGGMSEKIVLTRPFAQLNIASTDEDHGIAEAAGFGCDMLTSKIYIKNVYDTFDAYNEKPSGSANINFNLAAVPGNSTTGEVLKQVKGQNDTQGQDYRGYLSMNYFLAEAGSSQNVDVEARFESSTPGAVPVKISVPHVPVRRNYRTNIIGNILTEQAVFNIIIDPNFKTPDYIVGWDGKSTTAIEPNAEGIYEVSSASQLAWIAKQVNEGTKNFNGETLKLMEDIDLGGQLWTPIGTGSSVCFNGYFDGNGKTIRNYVINDEDGAGLFGYVGFGSIKNLTVSDVTVIGHHYAGALIGWIQNPGTSDPNRKITIVDNCHAKNVIVTLTPDANKDNGDKAGGLIGYAVRTSITNCCVENAKVTAYRDCGGLLGHANVGSKDKDINKVRVIGNKVTNSVVTADQTPEYKTSEEANAGKVVGRIHKDAVKNSNEAINVEVIVIKP